MSSTPEPINHGRRRFLTAKAYKNHTIHRLPWVVSEQRFLDACTQCGDCISACEQNIIERDAKGMPFVNFNQNECTFCQQCVDVCQQDFFREVTEKAWFSQLNIKDNCLAKSDIYCQSCRDVCDSAAISFTFSQGPIPKPQINQAACTACGACISTCPNDSTELIQLVEVTP
ncbi:ferredoxin-type protein NapF [Thalassotalea aquiviva]|uniref:ferredoxin-type protein NapF n=1 Tax=Thalassotalea aquiviva TaxID=3242415 RepID=UPI00352A0888